MVWPWEADSGAPMLTTAAAGGRTGPHPHNEARQSALPPDMGGGVGGGGHRRAHQHRRQARE
jgi:hypothetical protein